jgi:putative ABC transport system substrate-binding protein
MKPERRELLRVLACTALCGPRAGNAQQAGRVARIGWLGGPSREAAEPFVREFRQGLNELGWVEGRNLVIEWRFAGGRAERLPELAAELVRLRVEIIVVPSTPTALAAKQSTATIPIVTVAVGDPVALGLVPSLARPGGNITGLTGTVGPAIAGKLLELLKEALPKVSCVAVLSNPGTSGNALWLQHAQAAARSLAVDLQSLEARGPADFESAFAAMTAKRAEALVLAGDILFLNERTRLAELAVQRRLPTMCSMREYAQVGGLMSYGPSSPDLFRRAATYVDKILDGARPADLPIEQPTKFELLVNLKTAARLGVSIPSSLLLRADEVIR